MHAILTIFVLTYVFLSGHVICDHNSVHATHYSKRRFEILPQLIRLPLSLYHQTFLQPLFDKSDSIDIFSSS